MKVNVKKLIPAGQIPTYAKDGDAGLDLVATSKNILGDQIVYGTGLAIEIPKGYVGLIFPRSSISKYDLMMANSVGVIDSGYRGELLIKMNILNEGYHFYDIGDKIGQLIILAYPNIQLTEVEELSNTSRGSGGFGSTGK